MYETEDDPQIEGRSTSVILAIAVVALLAFGALGTAAMIYTGKIQLEMLAQIRDSIQETVTGESSKEQTASEADGTAEGENVVAAVSKKPSTPVKINKIRSTKRTPEVVVHKGLPRSK